MQTGAGFVSGDRADRVADSAERFTDVAADDAAGECAPDMTAGLELTGRDDRVVDPEPFHRVLYELDHLFFGHGANRIVPLAPWKGGLLDST